MKIPKKRLCLYSAPFRGNKSMADTILLAEKLGLGGVELMNFCREIRSPDRAVIGALARDARERGLALPCLTVGCDMLPDPDAAAERLIAYAEICAENGIGMLHHTIASGLDPRGLTPEERERRFQVCLPAVLRVCERAEALGVRTITEDQGFVFNGAGPCLRLVEASGGKIGLVADVGNILFADEKPEDFIRAAGSAILHVHLKDYAFARFPTPLDRYRSLSGRAFRDVEIGTGDIAPDLVTDELDRIGYAGMFSLEFARLSSDEEALRVIDRLSC